MTNQSWPQSGPFPGARLHVALQHRRLDRLGGASQVFLLVKMVVLFIIWFSRAENIPVKENDVAVESLIAEDVDWAVIFVGSIVGMSQVQPFKKRVGQLEYILYTYCSYL